MANFGAETSTVPKEVPRTHLLLNALVSIIRLQPLALCVAIVFSKASVLNQLLHCGRIMYCMVVN